MPNTLLIKNGRVLSRERFIPLNILCENGVIAAMGETLPPPDGARIYDALGALVGPGFIDVHTHGAVGVDMNGASEDGIAQISKFFASQGVTGFLPTLLTDSKERLLSCLATLARAKERKLPGAAVLGVHLEGPYLCRDYKGAMPESLLQLPSLSDFNEYQAAADGSILRITVSPEVEGVPAFIKQISGSGVAVSLGHSGADYDTAWQCIHNGAVSATHTFNAMKLMHQHFPAISGAVLESDVYCEAICDGIHLHPGTVRLLLKAKGFGRVVAVTDSIMAAGLGDGAYQLGVNDVVVKNGDAMLADGSTRAGSTLTMAKALANLRAFTNKPPEALWGLLSHNPAALCSLRHKKGSLEKGFDADITLLDENLTVQATFVAGKQVYQALTRAKDSSH